MLKIIDTGLTNVGSIITKLSYSGIKSEIITRPQHVEGSTRLILPGIGHFRTAMQMLKDINLIQPLEKKVLDEKVPILGICLGMQLFTLRSEEGNCKGLGWIEAETCKFVFDKSASLRIPHVGWNSIDLHKKSFLLDCIPTAHKFYFTHSYYVKCHDRKLATATTNYGIDFDSIIQKDNIYGSQFHPEKSHPEGFRLILNFASPNEIKN